MQRVIINGQASEWSTISSGVPQGSVLGPLLFLLFINDITHVVRHSKIRLFADDTCLFIEVDNRTSAADHIDTDLSHINNWAAQWLVTFSPTKTKSLIISTKSDLHLHPKVKLNGQEIEEVSSHTYLGLKFARSLRWGNHINDLSISARKRLNMMIPLNLKSIVNL